MQASELIDDEEMWEIEELVDRTKSRGTFWYKAKWVGWGDAYNQWLPEEELGNALDLKAAYDKQAPRERKRKREPTSNSQGRKSQRKR